MSEKEILSKIHNKLIELGKIYNLKVRNGEVNDTRAKEITKEICICEKQLFELKGITIPSKEDNKCPNCLSDISNGNAFCSECGTNIIEFYEKLSGTCKVCNANTKSDDVFCSICGNKL